MAPISETTPLAEKPTTPIITDLIVQDEILGRPVKEIPKHLRISEYKLPETPDIDLDTAFIQDEPIPDIVTEHVSRL